MPARPSGKNSSLSLDRTPTPYPATADDRDKPPFFARLFSSASSSKQPTHHKSAGHIPASELPPATAASSSTAAASSSQGQGEPGDAAKTQPKPSKLKFARTLSMPRLARTPTPYPEPQTPPKRKLSLSSLFGSKSSDEAAATPSTFPRRAQKRLAKLNLIRAPTPYPEQAHHSKPKSWWSAKKKQIITRDGARPQIVVLRKEPMRKAQSSMYVDGEAGASCDQEPQQPELDQRQGASTPVLNTDATVEIVEGVSKPGGPSSTAKSLASASASSSANTTPRTKLISFPSEPAINPNAASSSSSAAVARSKSTPSRRIHILEPDLEGVSRKSSRRPTEASQPATEAEPATPVTDAFGTTARATDASQVTAEVPSATTPEVPTDATPTPSSADLKARGITIVEGSTPSANAASSSTSG